MTRDDSALRKGLILAAIVAASALAGLVLAAQPLFVGLPLLLIGAVVLVVVPLVLRRPEREVILLVVVFLNYENLLRYTLLNDPLGGIVQKVRIPLVLAVGGLFLLFRGTRLFHGTGRASSQFVLLYLGWAVVSGLMCPVPGNAIFHVIALALLIVILAIAVSGFQDPAEFWRRWLGWLIVGLAVVLSISMLMVLVGAPIARADRMVLGAVGVGFRGLLSAPNDLAQVACLGLGATLGYAELSRRGRSAWWFFPMVLLCSIAGLASGARSGFVGVFSGLGYLTVSTAFRSKHYSRRQWSQIGVGAVGVVILAAGLAMTDVGRTQILRMTETADNVSANRVEVRQVVWGTYIRSLGRRPIFGVGYGNYATMDERYTQRLVGEHASHAALLEYTVTTGIPGTLLFLLAMWVAIRGAMHSSAGRFRASVIIFWAANWPIFLLSTGATGLAQVSGWAFWAPIIAAGAYWAVPQQQAAPMDRPLQIVHAAS